MPGWAHVLSYDECNAWREALGLEWEDLLRRASVKSHKDTVKDRWNKGKAPNDRAKIRAVLEAEERRKKESTPVGAMILGIEEWHQAGEILARKPEVFLELLRDVREKAAAVAQLLDAEKKAADATAKLNMSAFRDPKKSRK